MPSPEPNGSSSDPAPSLTLYDWPPEAPASPDYALRVEGKPVFVHHSPFASFAHISLAGPASIEVEVRFSFRRLVLRPLSRGVRPEVEESLARFDVPGPGHYSLEADDQIRRPLFLFFSPPETDVPRPDDPNVRFFEAGKIHDAGEIALKSGQTCYIEGGAVVRGHVIARDAENVALRGRGILDGGAFTDRREEKIRQIHLAGCRDVLVEGLVVFDSQRWTLVPAGCDRVRIRNVKLLSSANSDDGIDIVGSREVEVADSFVRTKDDCIAIKAIEGFHPRSVQPVRDILVERCVFWNAEWGNALEIGYETRTESISRVVFRDCDIVRCEAEGFGSGGALTIHNGDRAAVSDILYENLRLEQVMEKLIDFKISKDRYSRDETRGQIKDVALRDIQVLDGPFPVSIIQGYGRDHIPSGIRVENLRILGQPIRSANEARLVAEKARDLKFS